MDSKERAENDNASWSFPVLFYTYMYVYRDFSSRTDVLNSQIQVEADASFRKVFFTNIILSPMKANERQVLLIMQFLIIIKKCLP